MSLMTLAAGVILCGFSIFRGVHGETFMGRPAGGDFVEFYVIGKILNNFEPSRIYDLKLAVDLQHSVLPSMAHTQMLVYGHAPYVAVLFKPFAMLPYLWAYCAWLAFSAALYLSGVVLLFRATGLPAEHQKTAFLLAASFTPFLFETWIGGQLSVVGFFVWVLFFCLRHQNRLFLAGTALAFGIFKPTLIALPVAMLIFGRRWRVLAGFAAGAAAMGMLSVGLVGVVGCRAWIDTLIFNGRIAARPGEAWHLAKSVDLNSFFHLLLFNSPVTELAAIGSGLVAFVALAAAWSRSKALKAPAEDLLWAATLCLTLVVNSYAPIYDAVLVVIAVALARQGGHEPEKGFRGWLLFLYMSPWLTQQMAEYLHFQLFTLILAGFGTSLLTIIWRQVGLLDINAIQLSSKKVLHPGVLNRP